MPEINASVRNFKISSNLSLNQKSFWIDSNVKSFKPQDRPETSIDISPTTLLLTFLSS